MLYLSWGTLRGLRRLFTTGETSPGLGSTGLLAHSAALVSCETREKLLSVVFEEVRKTRLILDFRPVGGGCTGIVGMGISCEYIYMGDVTFG